MKKASKNPDIRECLESLCRAVEQLERHLSRVGQSTELTIEEFRWERTRDVIKQAKAALSRGPGKPGFAKEKRQAIALHKGTLEEAAQIHECSVHMVSKCRREFASERRKSKAVS